MKKYKSKYISR